MKWLTTERLTNFTNNHEMLKHGLAIYDALHSWCREPNPQRHAWTYTDETIPVSD
jgi:hypothetical protein